MIFGLWLGFTAFAGAVALLFWLVLHFSFQVKYQEQSVEEVGGAVQSIWEKYGQKDFENNISFLARTNGYFVQIISEEGNDILLSVNSQGERSDPQQDNIADPGLFQKLDESDGYCQYYVEDETHPSKWLVRAVVLANVNGNRQVLIVSKSLADVEALNDLLNSRYLLVTAVVLVLASFISVWLAEYFARPFRHLNRKAQQMAAGNYETQFPREGPAEARQLAQTLEFAEQEFNKTEELRREFVANISHDMKTPLTVIKMYAEMLDSFSGEIPEKRAEHVQRILDETDKLTGFINDSMELARLQSGTMEMKEEIFSIFDTAQEVVERVCANRPDFQFRIECERDIRVKGDRRLIYRVIYNFAANAVKFAGERNEARITIRKYQGNVRVEVIDYGIGIAKEDLEKIWNRFYQVKPYERNKTGTGIGLNIASEILKMHYAPYGAESTPNEGTCFWFMLEACDDET